MLYPAPTAGDTAWFVRDRFGMFIHWGLYALAARHEWVKNYEEIGDAEYQKYFEHFAPDLFEPQIWAKAAREAGMKYVVITVKHHEGFCLWNSQFTAYKTTNTPFGRDALREIVAAFRAQDLEIGFYYSLLDWHHPDFTIDGIHPQRNHPDALKMNESRDMRRYAEYMRQQVRELLTDYGPVEMLWFDFSYPEGDPTKPFPQFRGKGRADWESEKLLALVRELAPRAMVNNRLDLPDVPADMHTPEQYQPTDWVKVDDKPVTWEACQTLSGSWGYHRDETTWKTPGQLIRMLIDTVSKGGNLLLNVGPTGRGHLDARTLEALAVYREWMKWHARSIYGCTQAEYCAPADSRYTQNGRRLYLHLFAWPFKHVHLPGLAGQVEYAQFLNDASEIPLKLRDWTAHQVQQEARDDVLTLEIPLVAPPVEVPVIELFLRD